MALPSVDKPIPFWFFPLFAMMIWGGQYVMRDLWEPDEARYTYVAREMDQSGSWLVPMRNGETYAHKPPLMFWLIKVGTVLTAGTYNGVSGRFPTFLGVMLSLWMVSRLALKWFDPPTAWRTVFILSTSSLFWRKAGTGQIDMLLLGLEMSALYFLFTQDEKPSYGRLIAAFCFMGLAVLAKGPVGLIVPLGIYIIATIFSGDAKKLKKTYWLWGIPLALLWPAVWLMGATLSGAPQHYLNELLFAQNVGRVTGEFGGHYNPVYYYLPYVIIDFLPWAMLVPISVRVFPADAAGRRRLKRLLGWMLFVIIFFSLCSGKRRLYILSVYPAASMLVAAAWPKLMQASAKWINGTVYPLIAAMLLVAVAGVVVPLTVDLPVQGHVLLPVSLAMGVGAVLLIRRYRSVGLDRRWFAILVGAFLLAESSIGMVVFPALNPLKTPKELASAAKACLDPSQELLLFRMNGEIFALYSDRKGLRVDTLADLDKEMRSQKKGIVVFNQKHQNAIKDRYPASGTFHAFKMDGKEVVFLKFDMTDVKMRPLG